MFAQLRFMRWRRGCELLAVQLEEAMSGKFLIAAATIPLLWAFAEPALAQSAPEKPGDTRRVYGPGDAHYGTTKRQQAQGTKARVSKVDAITVKRAKGAKRGASKATAPLKRTIAVPPRYGK
jgi:hypothetical protein